MRFFGSGVDHFSYLWDSFSYLLDHFSYLLGQFFLPFAGQSSVLTVFFRLRLGLSAGLGFW